MALIKPKHLISGDTICTVSVSHSWAGDANSKWRYDFGKKRLENLYGLNVLPAPNSMKGNDFLSKNLQARADDIMWAFENKGVNAIIANVGGNDSIKLLPFIDSTVIKNNPKIFIGMSDVMNINLLCLKAGLSTFYGHNLFTIGEAQGFHPYSEKWFRKSLFGTASIGNIEPSENWTCDKLDPHNENFIRNYYLNTGYELIQGQGVVQGKLIGGHTGIAWVESEPIALTGDDFNEAILFVEDIPEFFTTEKLNDFLKWLGENNFLQKLNGIIIGKLSEKKSFEEHSMVIKNIIGNEYGLKNLPVLYGLNFGHTSPIFVIPYGAKAEINCDKNAFSILESGVS